MAEHGISCWQPIETAPRDGTRFIALATDFPSVRLVRFYDEYDHYPTDETGRAWTSAPRWWMPFPDFTADRLATQEGGR